MTANGTGRASPADCADEDVHNPSVDGLQYVSDSFLHAKSGNFASQDSVTIAYGELPTPQ